MNRKTYPSDVSDDEWAFIAPYSTLISEAARQRDYPLREVFNGLRRMVRAGATWRMMPNDLPPSFTVFQQTQRWLRAGVFEAVVADLRARYVRSPMDAKQNRRRRFLIRARCNLRRNRATAPHIRERNGGRGAKRLLPLSTLGNLLALMVTPADEQDRALCGELAEKVAQATGEKVEIAFVDMGYTGENAAQQAQAQGIRLEVVKMAEARKGFVLLPRRSRGRAEFRLGSAIPPLGARLRAIAGDFGRLAFLGVCCPDAQTICRSYGS